MSWSSCCIRENFIRVLRVPKTGIFPLISLTCDSNFLLPNSEGDLKVIRPLIFLRERTLEDFSIQRNLPSRPSKIFSRMPDGIHSILKVQEVINPNVYDNIRHAIYPLLVQNCNFNLTIKWYLNLSLVNLLRYLFVLCFILSYNWNRYFDNLKQFVL